MQTILPGKSHLRSVSEPFGIASCRNDKVSRLAHFRHHKTKQTHLTCKFCLQVPTLRKHQARTSRRSDYGETSFFSRNWRHYANKSGDALVVRSASVTTSWHLLRCLTRRQHESAGIHPHYGIRPAITEYSDKQQYLSAWKKRRVSLNCTVLTTATRFISCIFMYFSRKQLSKFVLAR